LEIKIEDTQKVTLLETNSFTTDLSHGVQGVLRKLCKNPCTCFFEHLPEAQTGPL